MKKKLIHGLSYDSLLVHKFWLTMRLIILLFFVSLLHVSASVYSQKTKLNIKVENATLQQIFDLIQDQSDFDFFYKNEQIPTDARVSIEAKNESVEAILNSVLKDTGLKYGLVDKDIVIIPVEKAAEQQKKTISGKVTDSSGASLPGVSIVAKGTTNGVIADSEGKYTINVPENATLQFSFIGMKMQEIAIEGKTSINVVMLEETIGIEEVVATGYGVVRKRDLTGAISSIKSDKLIKTAVSSVSQSLSGKIAGLTVVQNSAQPGGSATWQIRGSATGRSPLFIVDGFPVTGKSEPASGNQYSSGNKDITLNTINPNDIESVEVLKDASATSIYGSRAAGGVVIITTKRGKKGEPTVEYKGSYSVQNLYNLPTMLDPKQFMQERNEVTKELWMRGMNVYPYGNVKWEDVANKYPGQKYSDSEINNFTGGTDWFDETTQLGKINQHDVTMTGGSEKTKYLVSFSSFNQDGVIKDNGFHRYSGRLNLDQDLRDWLKVGISSAFASVRENNVPMGFGQNEYAGVLRSALQFNPVLDIKDEFGNYTIDPDQSFIPNPVSLLEIDDESKNDDLLINSYIEARPLKGLMMKLTAGLNKNSGLRNTYLPTSTLYGARVGGQASKSISLKEDYLVNFITQYSKTIAEYHNVSIMGGYEYQKFIWEGFNAGNTKFPYDGVKWNNLYLGENVRPTVGSYGGSSELASFISRINYSFKDKYLLTINFRYDGSSNFSEENQWGFFPGFSAAWRISDESFLKNSTWISNLKLRAGYGQTGNDNLTGVLTYYSPGWNYGFNSISNSGIGLANIGNPDLKWETQTDLNVGVDFGFLKNRISGSIELYNRVISDLLGVKPLLSYQVITGINSNLESEKQTKGIDFQLNTSNIEKNNFNWTTDLTVTYYQDRWKKRDKSWKPDIYDVEQEVWGGWLSYETDGLVKVGETIPHMPGALPGTLKIKDLNGYLVDSNDKRVLDENGKPQYSGKPDGKLDNADLVRVGNNLPVSFGFNNSFRYKNFDANIYINGILNRLATNENNTYYLAEVFRIKDGTNMPIDILDRWSWDNQYSTNPSALQAYSPYGLGDFYVEDAWFVRLNNVNLGYTITSKNLHKGFEKIRFFIEGRNLFVITPYTGSDPETGGGVSYPNQHTYTAGIELKF